MWFRYETNANSNLAFSWDPNNNSTIMQFQFLNKHNMSNQQEKPNQIKFKDSNATIKA